MPISCVDAAFRSSRQNECYVFVKDKFVVLNYAPGAKKNEILDGPVHIVDGFPVLAKTPFENGIDCAFETDHNEAFIFSGNQCARIDYAPHSTNARIISGPTTITTIFSCLRGTTLENGVDAAIRSVNKHVYLFKGDEYYCIDYQSERVVTNHYIRNGFPSLVGTVFESGIDASFASHVKDEAYIFKGNYYARINVAPGTNDDYIVGGRIKRILDDWPSLSSLLQSQN